jgi:quinol monooxygenase YgiN
MIALVVVALGAVVAAVGTGVLTARSTQTPRIYFLAWAFALFGLAIGLGAATLGYLAGFGDVLFRAMEFGAQLLAPLSLCLAMAEISGRGLAARFAMRLAVSGLGIIGLVIMGTDPLNPNAIFSKSWADPTVFYQLVPLAVLGVLAVFTAVVAVVTIVLAVVRSSREDLPRNEVRPAILTGVAGLVLAGPGLSWLTDKGLGFSLPIGAQYLFALGSAASAVLIWYAARIAGQRDLSHSGFAPAGRRENDDDWDDDLAYDREHDRFGRQTESYRSYETGEFGQYGPDGHDYDDAEYRGRRPGPGDRPYRGPESEFPYPGLAALAAEPSVPPGDESGVYDSAAYDSAAFDSAAFDSRGFDSAGYDRGQAAPGHYDDSRQFEAYPQPGWEDNYEPGYDEEPAPQMFGQITIYTLNEDYSEDFDRLTEWVVAQVRSNEPGTLAYIAHAVPAAPMQRILYEVYRDRIAHDEHLRYGYVQTYQSEQRPFVLAANVIELDLQQAKVSPLPTFSAISEMLSESGIDLTGITRSSPSPHGFQRSLPSGQSHQYYDEPGYQSGWAELRGDDPRYR